MYNNVDERQSDLEPTSLKDVRELFKKYGGKDWTPPKPEDIEAFHQLLEMVAEASPEPASDYEANVPDHPYLRLAKAAKAARVLAEYLPKVKAAAAYLARELPRMNDLGRKAVLDTKEEPTVSEAQLQKLENLQSAALASKDAFIASVFRAEKPSTDPRRGWYAAARIIASVAKNAWENAGNRRVSIGQGANSPVAQLTQAALERIGVRVKGRGSDTLRPVSIEAVAKMLYEWTAEIKRDADGPPKV